MKIILILPTLQQGGAERVMSELANRWSLLGHEVYLILLAQSDDFYTVADSIKVHRLGFENKGGIRKVYSEFKTLLRLRKTMKSVNPQFVLSFMDRFNVFTLISSLGLGVPVFVSDRENPLRRNGKFFVSLKRVSYHFSRGLIAQTDFAKSVLFEQVRHANIEVIPNPLVTIDIDESVKKEKILLNVGRLVEEKGQKYLIEAFARLSCDGWRLVILGEGPQRVELEDLVLRLGVGERVELRGTERDVMGWLAKSSIFVFPSISEGFPNALAEAMASGLACVSFDCNAGPRDLIKNNVNGMLVPVRDIGALSSAVQKLIDDEGFRMKLGAEARKVSSTLDGGVIAKRWMQFIFKNLKAK